MLDAHGFAELGLAQIEERRSFLQSLGNMEGVAWEILLRIYCCNTNSPDSVAKECLLPPRSAKRLFDLLEYYGYIDQVVDSFGRTIRLTTETRHQLELLLTHMAHTLPSDGSAPPSG